MTSFQISTSTSIISLESLSYLRRRQYPQGGFLFTEEGTEVETELREHSLFSQDRSLASLMGCSDPDPGDAGRGRQENWTFLIALEPGPQKLLLESPQLVTVSYCHPSWMGQLLSLK